MGNSPLAIGLSGSTWATEPTPSASGASDFNGVSCYTTTCCAAVGGQNEQLANGLNLVEMWNGMTWSPQSVPDANATLGDSLIGVNCFGPTSCVAGGWVNTGATATSTGNQAIAWNGSAWTLQTVPNAGHTNDNGINAVDCVPNDLCLSVGYQGDGVSPTSTEALTAPIYRPGYAEVASDGGVFNFGSPFYRLYGRPTVEHTDRRYGHDP